MADDTSSEEEEQEELELEDQPSKTASALPPKATSFSSKCSQAAANLKKIGISEETEQANTEEARLKAENIAKAAEDEGFVTENSEDEGGSESVSEDDDHSSNEVESSEDEAPKQLKRPTFIKKGARKEDHTTSQSKTEDELWADDEARRKDKADAMIQEQLEKDAIARAVGKKDWDDDEIEEIGMVDDTDGLDPETERAAWRLRELKRVKREREAIEIAEKEREEVERRRNLSKEEREVEDNEFLEAQKGARDGKGKMSYMQKYFHKGAFYQDDEVAETLANRDIMGSKIADDVANRELLPQFMQIRDMAKLGRKGRTKYKDLKTEDTGKYGQDFSRGPTRERIDERFMPDKERERSGANTAPLGERKKTQGDAPKGPKAERPRVDHNHPDFESRTHGYHQSREKARPYSRSRSPPSRRDRTQSYSRSRTPPRGRGYRDHHHRHKRSLSPYHERYASDKRRRVETD